MSTKTEGLLADEAPIHELEELETQEESLRVQIEDVEKARREL